MAEMHSWAVGSDTERVVTVEDARAATSALVSSAGGIVPRTGFVIGPTSPGIVTASGTPDANVTVAAFQLVMPNSRGVWPYVCTLDTPKVVDVLVANPADPSNTRYDLIVAQQSDAFYADADSLFRVHRITGTPSATPADPDVPGSPDYELLARVRVTAGATAITTGMIDDLRITDRTGARGGVIPCTSATRPAAPHPGMTIFETDTGMVRVWSAVAAAWAQVWTEVSGQMTTALPVRINSTGGASPSSSGHGFQIGPSSGANVRMDINEIQAADNGVAADLWLQESGGRVLVGTGGIDVNGPSIFDDAITSSPAESATSLAIQFNHAYALYVDNINAAGGAGSRMWLDTPNSGNVVIGPRTLANHISDLRLRTNATTGSAANVFINSSTFAIARSTSSLKYKVDVVDLTVDLTALRALRPVRFRDRREVQDDPTTTQTYVGLIAEEVHALGLHEFVHYMTDEDTGERVADGVQYDRLTVAQHLLIEDLEARLAAQGDQIADLDARLAALESAA